MVEFNKNRVAAAVSAAVATGLAAPAGAVVVVGGDNGWEISFDGNINAFYTVADYDEGFLLNTDQSDQSRIHSGFLPAFFSFNAKSPTVNGLTGTARISFAPTIQNGGAKTQFSAQGNSTGAIDGINGATIDTREVLANISGDFGEISFGRTLSLFGRQAILNDMTLFGVGFAPGPNAFGSVTFGRVGHGYTYPDFSARVQYTTPNINGFQAAVGMYDPSQIVGITQFSGLGGNAGYLDETDTPRFEGELSYANTFQGGNFKLWFDGTYQDVESSCSGTVTNTVAGGVTGNCSDEITVSGWGVGGLVGFSGFQIVGYYYDGDGLGLTAQFNSLSLDTYVDSSGVLQADESESDGYYVQGTYTFNGKTKVGVSYGQSAIERDGNPGLTTDDVEIERNMWTVGVYHDVNSWLKLIAEYNQAQLEVTGAADDPESNTFSVGSFFFW